MPIVLHSIDVLLKLLTVYSCPPERLAPSSALIIKSFLGFIQLTLKVRLRFIAWCCRWRRLRIMMMVLVWAVCHQQEKWLGLHQQSVGPDRWQHMELADSTADSAFTGSPHLAYTVLAVCCCPYSDVFLPSAAAYSYPSTPKSARITNSPFQNCKRTAEASCRSTEGSRGLLKVSPGSLSRSLVIHHTFHSFLEWSINFQLFFPQSICLESALRAC